VNSAAINAHDWDSIQTHLNSLEAEVLTAQNVPAWLLRWNTLEVALANAGSVAYRAMAEDTTNTEAEETYLYLVKNIRPKIQVANQRLKTKLLAVTDFEPGLEHELMLKRLQVEANLFRAQNVPLRTELTVLASEYDKIVGAMNVVINGREQTIPEASMALLEPDRDRREQVWHAINDRHLEDQTILDDLFLKMLALRQQVARNAGLRDYREYIWHNLARFDYTPEDCETFHAAILEHVVPLANRLLEQDRINFGLECMRPWDFDWRFPMDSSGLPPLKPFETITELEAGGQRIFDAVDPGLGAQFASMRDGFLDLGSRAGKASGGYCDYFPLAGKPYIFMNSVGTQDDVKTLLHEGGHAFHAFAFGRTQPLIWNHWGPTEFAEVGSMAMELLASPYFERDKGGFYSSTDAIRARRELLCSIVRFLPYMAIVDSFQHWIYTTTQTLTAADLHAKWDELWDRYSPGVDWTGLEAAKRTRWHRQGHVFTSPFYYVEYGMAQLGALQIWRNALEDQASALTRYKQALEFGGTKSIPDLFAAAGAKFAFDSQTVGELMTLIEQHLE
jgi:oligoendopeptidase F